MIDFIESLPHRSPSRSSSRMSSASSGSFQRSSRQCHARMHRRATTQCQHRIDLARDPMHRVIRVVLHCEQVRRISRRVHSMKLNSKLYFYVFLFCMLELERESVLQRAKNPAPTDAMSENQHFSASKLTAGLMKKQESSRVQRSQINFHF